MVFKICAIPEAFREIAREIDNSESVKRKSKSGCGDDELDELETKALFTYLRENCQEYTACTDEQLNSVFENKPSTFTSIMNPDAFALDKTFGIKTAFNPLFPYGDNEKASATDRWIDPAGATAEMNGIKYNLNPVKTVFGQDNKSKFSKAARIADPGLTTVLDNVGLSKKSSNAVMWAVNPIGKAISAIFG